jgi:hypothetical protein
MAVMEKAKVKKSKEKKFIEKAVAYSDGLSSVIL